MYTDLYTAMLGFAVGGLLLGQYNKQKDPVEKVMVGVLLLFVSIGAILLLLKVQMVG